jgi:hypothetical protein
MLIGFQPNRRLSKLLLLLSFMGLMLIAFAASNRRQPSQSWPSPDRSDTTPPESLDGDSSTITTATTSRPTLFTDQVVDEHYPSSFLPEDRPPWIAAADDISGPTHYVSVGSDIEDSLEQCRASLNARLLATTYRYVDEHLANHRKIAHRIPFLTTDWIRRQLMDQQLEYAAVMELPSGTYHQLWYRLNIDAADRQQLAFWVRQLETRQRVGLIGLLFTGLLVIDSCLYTGLGWVCRRGES